jgi:Flp pilus assembly protein TadG
VLTRDERGSVLLLVPAGVLVVIVLASIAVDFAIAFLGEREVASLASAAANDAASAAVDEAHLRTTGEFRIDPDRAEDVVAATIAASSVDLHLDAPVVDVIDIGGEPAVRVRLTGRIDYVFAPALPGAPDGADVSASAVAVADEG